MTNDIVNKALEGIYESLMNDNESIDAHILALKNAMQANGAQSVEINPTKIPQPNRQGRKLMQSYFKQRGVVVTFAEAKA